MVVGKRWFKIEQIGEADRNDVIRFLRLYFYKDEPIDQALGITDSVEEENWVCEHLADGCSFKAVNAAGEMVALKLNGVRHRDSEFNIKSDNAKFNILLDFLKRVDSDYDVFAAVPDCGDRIVEGKVLSVHDDYRQQGIASALYEATTDWMAANGIRNMITLCSSYYTALACTKLGYALVYELNFADYIVNGECPILPKSPHTTLKAYLTTVASK